MTFDFAGSELEAFNNNNGAVTELNSGRYDGAASRCAIRVGYVNAAHWVETPNLTARTTAWLHFNYGFDAGDSGKSLLEAYNDVGTAVFRLRYTSNGVLQAQYWTGAVWTNIGGTWATPTLSLAAVDLKIICGASGSYQLFSGGSPVSGMLGSASMTAVTNIARYRWFNCTGDFTGVNQPWLTEVIVGNETTVGHKFYTKPPTGNGANTAWTGAFGDVNELAISQANFIQSTVNDEVETFTGAAITLPGATAVRAVVISTQAKNSATGPQNVQGAIRKGGVNYFSADIAGIGVGYAPAQAIFALDPATGVAWTNADAGAATLEFGARSRA